VFCFLIHWQTNYPRNNTNQHEQEEKRPNENAQKARPLNVRTEER
jgi:hypothetical protein